MVLDAGASSDLDTNSLEYNWYFFDAPSSYNGTVSVQNGNSSAATVSVPSDASGENIHIILELNDNGDPDLYAPRRVIINVE